MAAAARLKTSLPLAVPVVVPLGIRAGPDGPVEVASEARGLLISAIAVDGLFRGALRRATELFIAAERVSVEVTRGLGAVGLVVATLFARLWDGPDVDFDRPGAGPGLTSLPVINDSRALLALV